MSEKEGTGEGWLGVGLEVFPGSILASSEQREILLSGGETVWS